MPCEVAAKSSSEALVICSFVRHISPRPYLWFAGRLRWWGDRGGYGGGYGQGGDRGGGASQVTTVMKTLDDLSVVIRGVLYPFYLDLVGESIFLSYFVSFTHRHATYLGTDPTVLDLEP